MAKIDNLKELRTKALVELCQSKEYTDFLRFAARMYKMPFSDAVMVYAHDPEIEKAAQLSAWNAIGRKVKRGAHGIPVLGDRDTVRYYFDISDTDGKTLPPLWSLNREEAGKLKRYFSSTYDQDFLNFSSVVDYISYNSVSEHYDDLESMADKYSLNDEQITTLHEMLWDCVRYTTAARCELGSEENIRVRGAAALDFDDTILQNDSDLMLSFFSVVQHTAQDSINEIAIRAVQLKRNQLDIPEEIVNAFEGEDTKVEQISATPVDNEVIIANETVKVNDDKIPFSTEQIKTVLDDMFSRRVYALADNNAQELVSFFERNEMIEPRAEKLGEFVTSALLDQHNSCDMGSFTVDYIVSKSGVTIMQGEYTNELYTDSMLIGWESVVGLYADEIVRYYKATNDQETKSLDNAKNYINDFCLDEYSEEADFSDLSNIPIAYTTDEQTEYEIQVSIDLLQYRMIYQYDGQVVREEQYGSLDDMNENALSVLDFDDLVSLSDDEKAAALEKRSNSGLAEKEKLPTITCEWSESEAFEEGKTYSVYDFDRIMEQADREWIEKRQAEIDKYGEDIKNIYEAFERGEIDGVHQGYAKTKFTVTMPDGTTYTDRQDIGDGFGGVIDFIKRYNKALAFQLEKVRDMQKANEEPESKEKSFSEQVDDVLDGNADRYSDLKVCDTPQLLLDVGCDQLPMLYTKKHLRDALHEKSEKNHHWHGLTVEQIKKVPDLISDPLIVFDSISINDKAKGSIITVLNAVDNDNSPIIVSIKPNGKGNYELETIDSNFITSIYGKDNSFSNFIERAANANNILYWNKQKSQELFSVLGLHLPKGLNDLDSNIIIHQSHNIVNSNSVNYEKIVESNTQANSEQISFFNENTVNENSAEAVSKDIPSHTYHFDLNDVTGNGAKTRYKANVAAIRTLKKIESENRNATLEEQRLLAGYVGWGGVADAFDARKDNWHEEYEELKGLLTDDEYRAARRSTQTSYYTSHEVIESIYSALDNFGFKGGNILEPSMGVGNFFAEIPSEMRDNSKLYGVELDDLTGRIAKKLYPNDNIQIKGFEKTSFSDNSFDVVVGNVPFGDFKVHDKKYDRLGLNIHDYFIAKSVDQVRPGGMIAVVTSSYTMDKNTSKFREYIAQRCDLVGAVRLPNNAFADTKTVSDILFLQKRENQTVVYPYWTQTGRTADGLRVNAYFARHPEMVLGKVVKSTRYGDDSETIDVIADTEKPLSEQLAAAVSKLHANIPEKIFNAVKIGGSDKKTSETIPADPYVRNFTYTVINGEVYYRENEVMTKYEGGNTAIERIKGMHAIRQSLRSVIDAQLNGVSDDELAVLQRELNNEYDTYVKRYGALTSKANTVFRDDDDFNTLIALENVDEKTGEVQKASIFFKRTILPSISVDSVDTPEEALQVSLDRKGCVDIDYMAQLVGMEKQELVFSLKEQNKIFRDPAYTVDGKEYSGYVEAAEYLSGNVRKKLALAAQMAKLDPQYEYNVQALEVILPDTIPPEDILVQIGINWVDCETYTQFLTEYTGIDHSYNNLVTRLPNGEYTFKNRCTDNSSRATEIFGTDRMEVHEIFKRLLNKRSIEVKDRTDDDRYVLNESATRKAKEKANQMERAFEDWLWADMSRQEHYVEKYNNLFNSLVGREYNGDGQKFDGMNPDITLIKHQLDAVMRAKLGGNTLLAHVVGAGKSFEMATAVMEKRRLGLITKACVTVPKPLTDQMANEWLKLYPNAHLLVASAKDFTKENRQRFIARCATGNYDAIIMSHEQFGKIGMSAEYQTQFINEQIEAIDQQLSGMNSGYYFQRNENQMTVKALEKQKEKLTDKLEKLLGMSKDTSLSFEQLGFDYLVVDEAHNFKNCFVATKMGNISGVQTSASQKAEDMLMKTTYLNNKYGCNNILFATGTPISNSMVEMYVMTRYLRPDVLAEAGVSEFDDWASNFGKVVSKLEVNPAGNGYRTKKRFAEFINLPELVKEFKEFADIKTQKMIKLNVPEITGGEPNIVVIQPSEAQREGIKELGERSERIHNGSVSPNVDNMLKITHEARLLGLDPRCLDPLAEKDPDGKIATLCRNIKKKYDETEEQKGVQAVFCDIAVNADRGFSAYDEIKADLIELGIPEEEICFAGDAKNEKQRVQQHEELRNGIKRVVVGSTSKLGTGVNIQNKLCALHHLDIPWKPSDFEQRNGRGIRRGNTFPNVDINFYVTQDTFDMYLMDTIVRKAKFIEQGMSSTSQRKSEDMDEVVLTYSKIQAATTSNPYIAERIELEQDLNYLHDLKSDYMKSKYKLMNAAEKELPERIARYEELLAKAEKDNETRVSCSSEDFMLKVDDVQIVDKEKAAALIFKARESCAHSGESVLVGEYNGFDIYIEPSKAKLSFFSQEPDYEIVARGKLSYSCSCGENNGLGNITRIENLIDKAVQSKCDDLKINIENATKDMNETKAAIEKPFEHEEELKQKESRFAYLNDLLSKDKRAQEILSNEPEEDMEIECSDQDNGEEREAVVAARGHGRR